MRPISLHAACVVTVLLAAVTAWSAAHLAGAEEASFETAKNWFPPVRNVWTPVGVKNHPFRFTLLYNGTIIAETHPLRAMPAGPIKEYLNPYIGQGVQLTLTPSFDGSIPQRSDHSYQLSSRPDGGVGMQGWDDEHATPVLWTRWPMNHLSGSTGVVVRQEVFAHTPGGKPVETGKEPLYLWVRLSVEHVDPFEASPNATMMIHVGNPDMMQRSMWHEENLTVHPERAIYPRVLKRDTYQKAPLSCCRLVEPDGKVRLVGMMAAGSAMLTERTEGSRDYYLQVTDAGREGDACRPARADDPRRRRRGAGRGRSWLRRRACRDGQVLVREARRRPQSSIRLSRRSTAPSAAWSRLAQVISETNPENGDRALLTGNWNYDTLWPTPTCMATHMLLDHLGYHQFVADNLKIFHKYQGSTKPPGRRVRASSRLPRRPQATQFDRLADRPWLGAPCDGAERPALRR